MTAPRGPRESTGAWISGEGEVQVTLCFTLNKPLKCVKSSLACPVGGRVEGNPDISATSEAHKLCLNILLNPMGASKSFKGQPKIS